MGRSTAHYNSSNERPHLGYITLGYCGWKIKKHNNVKYLLCFVTECFETIIFEKGKAFTRFFNLVALFHLGKLSM